MSGRTEDRTLIDECRAGKTESYGALVRRYQDRLYPTILRISGRAEDAQDLVQETFLCAYKNLGRFQGESSFYTWIYRIAVNLALSRRRRHRPEVRLRPGATEPEAATSESDPSVSLQNAERARIIQDALNALADDHRAVVVLKEFDGLRYEEIGAILGIPVGTVRSRLHRARCELRERLRPLVDEEIPTRHVLPETPQ